MRLQAKRTAGVDTKRLERCAAAQEAVVVGADHRLHRIDEAAARHGEREHGHGPAPGP